MKKNDLAEIKKIDQASLKERVKKLQKEILDLLFDKGMGKISNSKQIKNKRRDLAQMMTILRQKQLIAELEAKK
ncbi:MAG: 50S ribosomal protein L29 [bacterium]|nr:50S ribosomal protein L29 [bacterium]